MCSMCRNSINHFYAVNYNCSVISKSFKIFKKINPADIDDFCPMHRSYPMTYRRVQDLCGVKLSCTAWRRKRNPVKGTSVITSYGSVVTRLRAGRSRNWGSIPGRRKTTFFFTESGLAKFDLLEGNIIR